MGDREILNMIEHNGDLKRRYSTLLDELEAEFRRQLKYYVGPTKIWNSSAIMYHEMGCYQLLRVKKWPFKKMHMLIINKEKYNLEIIWIFDMSI